MESAFDLCKAGCWSSGLLQLQMLMATTIFLVNVILDEFFCQTQAFGSSEDQCMQAHVIQQQEVWAAATLMAQALMGSVSCTSTSEWWVKERSLIWLDALYFDWQLLQITFTYPSGLGLGNPQYMKY